MRIRIFAAIFLATCWMQAASAGSSKPFTPGLFEAAQSSGRPVLIEVYAPWCPICARQQPILDELEASGPYANVTVLRVDFDHQKSALYDLHVLKQSTLIGYHGTTETGRLIGVVQRSEIEKLLASTRKG